MSLRFTDMRTSSRKTISHSLGRRALPVWWILPRTGPQVCFVPLPYLGDLVSLKTLGFNTASHNPIKASLDLILPESVRHISLRVSVHPFMALQGNLTLDDNMCPNAGDGDAESERWLAIYAPPITQRLNSAAPGANLTDEDTNNLMSLCAFHSQAIMAPSPFCGLFTSEEFRGFEYFGDVDKFYDNG